MGSPGLPKRVTPTLVIHLGRPFQKNPEIGLPFSPGGKSLGSVCDICAFCPPMAGWGTRGPCRLAPLFSFGSERHSE